MSIRSSHGDVRAAHAGFGPVSMLVLLAMIATACDPDGPVEPIEDLQVMRSFVDAAPAAVTVEPPTKVLVDLDLTVGGNLRPGSPIQLVGVVRARKDLHDFEFKIWAPEVEFARVSGWGAEYQSRLAWTVPSLVHDRVPLEAGSRRAASTTLTIPSPGIYRVVLSVDGVPTEPEYQDQVTQHKVVWLLVDHEGGRVLADFDRALVPEGFIPAPGPFRSVDSTNGNGLAAIEFGQYEVTVRYWDLDAGQYLPLPNHTVEFLGQNQSWQYPEQEQGVTDAQGHIWWNCPTEWQEVWISVALRNSAVRMSSQFTESANYSNCYLPQGGAVFEMTDSATKVFLQTSDAEKSAVDVFGRSRSQVAVSLGEGNISQYNPSADEIRIANGRIWGSRARSTHFHEYGHALHFRAFGGWTSIPNCEDHFPGKLTSAECAYVEGFAEFFAEISGAGLPLFPLEPANYTHNAPDGTYDEGAFGGSLLDIVDASDGEPWDNSTISGSFIADALQSCRIFYNGIWWDASRSDWVMACLQASGDGFDMWFPSAYAPTGVDAPAVPFGWRRSDIQANYEKNMFDGVPY